LVSQDWSRSWFCESDSAKSSGQSEEVPMGGFSSLGINLPLLVAFLINFAVLFILLKIFLYKPILKMLDERAKKTQEGMELAEATKKEYEQAKAEVQRQIEKGHQEAQAIITQATQVGEKLKGESREEAVKQAQTIIDRTRAELATERDQLVGRLRKEFVDISIAAAEKVIKETLDKEKHKKLIEETLLQSTALKKS
jgi:F-type H+-transporting ATPase subunit b